MNCVFQKTTAKIVKLDGTCKKKEGFYLFLCGIFVS